MEGTHTVLLLYPPIRELSNITLYFPKRQAQKFSYKSHAPHSEGTGNGHVRGKDDLAESKQRGQSSRSSGRLHSSHRATKEAVAELCWLVTEHHQLLAELLSLCRVCANKVRMGNQDGKLQDRMEGREVYTGGQDPSRCSLTQPPEAKRAACKSKKQKKSGGKKLESAELFLHSNMKKKVASGASCTERPAHVGVSASPASGVEQMAGAPPSASVSSVKGSYVSTATNHLLPMDEPFHITREGWDFMVDNQTFEPDMDFFNDFSEYDGELGYDSSFCRLMKGPTRRESESNLRPAKRFDSVGETCDESSRRNTGVRVVVKVQDLEGKVQHVGRTSPDGAGPHPETSSGQQEHGEQRGPTRDKTGCKLSEGLQLPLTHSTESHAQKKPHTKSPSSPSLAGVFNTSFPASNTLQRMSPGLSPLTPKEEIPQLNHRIVLLSDKDVDPHRDSSGTTDEPRILTEVIDKNGNKRSVTRLDLNLSRRPSNSQWNSPSNSSSTGEL